MSVPDNAIRIQLYERLRRPASAHTVPGALPVLFFGDLITARMVTVSLNPSWREYLDDQRRELTGAARRFENLNSLGANDRATLTDEQCERAITKMRNYFKGPAAYRWFRHLARVTEAMGASYCLGKVAHLDLAQEATDPTWTVLRQVAKPEAQELLADGLEYLRWLLAVFPIETVLCNGQTALSYLTQLVGGVKGESGMMRRVAWSTWTGRLGAKQIVIAGWNIPLDKPTGLRDADETALGQTLMTALHASRTVE